MNWLILNLLTALGASYAWHRAEPLKPLRSSLIVFLHRLYDRITPDGAGLLRRFLGYPVWVVKAANGCLPCSSFWIGILTGLILGSGPVDTAYWPVVLGLSTYFISEILDRKP